MPWLLPLFGLTYPFLVYLGLGALDARQLALLLLTGLGLRVALADRENWRAWLRATWLPLSAVAAVSGITALSNEARVLMLGPALFNAALLFSFASSLLGESTVERLARIRVPELPPAEIRYCRWVTGIWCVFFAGNGGVALWLAVWGSPGTWALYTGFVSYLLMAILYGAEFCIRQWRFRRYLGWVTDPFFRRIFPPLSPAETLPPATRDDGDSRMQPEILGVRKEGERLEVELRIPKDLACWPGHFPQYPIVPGVLQLQWVVEEIARWTGSTPQLTQVDVLKFKTPMLPGQYARLCITRDADATRFEFEIAQEEVVYSQGRIVLAAGDAR